MAYHHACSGFECTTDNLFQFYFKCDVNRTKINKELAQTKDNGYVELKIWKIVHKNNCPVILKFCPSDENLPNLVTLFGRFGLG